MFAKRPFVTLFVLVGIAPWAAWSAVVVGRAVPADCEGLHACDDTTPVPNELSAVLGDSSADLCRELAIRLPQRLDQPCRTVIQPPFVLAGDLSEAELQTKFVQTVEPVCNALLASYFRRLPDRPVTILMFATEAAYRRAAEQLFFDRSVSRFGYYKPGRRTVLVNLAEGDGGLLHELTHVLMDADFPDAPLWLQEGLATLHESSDVRAFGGQADATSSAAAPAAGCAERTRRTVSRASGGTDWQSVLRVEQTRRLVPRHNWRLAVLSRAVAENRLPSVKQLIAESTFRGAGEALDFAHVRYFCWFLHERDKLQQLYAKLRERSAADPTGAATLREVLGDQEWESIDRDFRVCLAAIAHRPS